MPDSARSNLVPSGKALIPSHWVIAIRVISSWTGVQRGQRDSVGSSCSGCPYSAGSCELFRLAHVVFLLASVEEGLTETSWLCPAPYGRRHGRWDGGMSKSLVGKTPVSHIQLRGEPARWQGRLIFQLSIQLRSIWIVFTCSQQIARYSVLTIHKQKTTETAKNATVFETYEGVMSLRRSNFIIEPWPRFALLRLHGVTIQSTNFPCCMS